MLVAFIPAVPDLIDDQQACQKCFQFRDLLTVDSRTLMTNSFQKKAARFHELCLLRLLGGRSRAVLPKLLILIANWVS